MLSFKQFITEARVSPRLPTAKRGADPIVNTNRVDLPTMQRNRPSFEHNIDVLRNPEVYQDMPQGSLHGISHDEAAERIIEHFKNNILHIHDSMPEEQRGRTRQWYDGAHALVGRRAKQYGIGHNTASAVYALLSPQKGWDENVSLGDRVLDIYHNKAHHDWSPEMEKTSSKIWKKKDQPVLDAIRGKKLSELTDPTHKAMWIRTYDEAHHDRSHAIITPEGDESPNRGKHTRWQSLGAVSRAVRAIESNGDDKTLSGLLGSKHKVRHFYNNIHEPNSSEGDVTIDTHAVAAAHMRPYGSSAMPVHHNFGSTPPKKARPKSWKPVKSGGSKTGIQGTYPLYAEAYRRAAHERGILPREMQSVVWEGVRAMFPDNKKRSPAFVGAINAAWQGHHQGQYDANEARRRVDEVTGKLNTKKYKWS